MSFDKLRTIGKGMFSFVVSLSNHERNRLIQRFSQVERLRGRFDATKACRRLGKPPHRISQARASAARELEKQLNVGDGGALRESPQRDRPAKPLPVPCAITHYRSIVTIDKPDQEGLTLRTMEPSPPIPMRGFGTERRVSASVSNTLGAHECRGKGSALWCLQRVAKAGTDCGGTPADRAE